MSEKVIKTPIDHTHKETQIANLASTVHALSFVQDCIELRLKDCIELRLKEDGRVFGRVQLYPHDLAPRFYSRN